jgi:pyridoxal 5'-phosphate synthase pdxT subunit
VAGLEVGVLALQGGFEAQIATLRGLGAVPREVRTPEDLEGLDALVVPGGESTTIGKMIASAGLESALRAHHQAGRPILGTCAGMIVLANEVEGGEPLLGLMDIAVRRNAYGRQVDSFEADLDVRGVEHPVRGVFIRAPWIERVGEGVEILATFEGRPVVLEEGNLLVASFHPELVGETGLHRYLLKKV